jgi:hypothetical protein
VGLVIDGGALSVALHVEHIDELVSLCTSCKSVVCCRCVHEVQPLGMCAYVPVPFSIGELVWLCTSCKGVVCCRCVFEVYVCKFVCVCLCVPIYQWFCLAVRVAE